MLLRCLPHGPCASAIGVYPTKKLRTLPRKWRCEFKSKLIGCFETKWDAARAYKAAASSDANGDPPTGGAAPSHANGREGLVRGAALHANMKIFAGEDVAYQQCLSRATMKKAGMIGRTVRKEFPGYGIFTGRVISYRYGILYDVMVPYSIPLIPGILILCYWSVILLYCMHRMFSLRVTCRAARPSGT